MIVGRTSSLFLAGCLAASCYADERPASRSPESGPSDSTSFNEFVESNCLDCHDHSGPKAGLSLDDLIARGSIRIRRLGRKSSASFRRDRCRRAMRRGRTEEEYDAAIAWLESSLDAAAAAHPNPGRTETFRRLNRTEYQNAIRDLLALDIDVDVALAAG